MKWMVNIWINYWGLEFIIYLILFTGERFISLTYKLLTIFWFPQAFTHRCDVGYWLAANNWPLWISLRLSQEEVWHLLLLLLSIQWGNYLWLLRRWPRSEMIKMMHSVRRIDRLNSDEPLWIIRIEW